MLSEKCFVKVFMSRLVVMVALIFCIGDAYSDSSGTINCQGGRFSSSYFLVERENIVSVSLFFRNMFDKRADSMSPFLSEVGSIERIEKYFDSEEYSVLKNNKELMSSEISSLPVYKTERESVFYRELEGEIVKNVMFEVRRYNKKLTPLDKHPLFGQVRRKERLQLINKLDFIKGFSPELITEKLEVKHNELIFLLTRLGEPVAAITLDKFHISNYGLKNTSLLMKFEIYNGEAASLFEDEELKLNNIMCNMENEFRLQFSGVQSVSWFGYRDYHNIANDILPVRVLFQSYPLLYVIGQVLVLVFIGFLLLYLLLGRYSPKSSYRKIVHGDAESDEK